MSWGIGEYIAILFPCFPREWGIRESGELFFPYRSCSGESGNQGEYIYLRYILPVSPFPIGATGAVGGLQSLRNSPLPYSQGGAL